MADRELEITKIIGDGVKSCSVAIYDYFENGLDTKGSFRMNPCTADLAVFENLVITKARNPKFILKLQVTVDYDRKPGRIDFGELELSRTYLYAICNVKTLTERTSFPDETLRWTFNGDGVCLFDLRDVVKKARGATSEAQ